MPPPAAPAPYETKRLDVPFALAECKAVEGGWQFSGHAAVFHNVDAGGDVLLRTAFDRTLRERSFRPLLWQHQMAEPIGVERSLTIDEKGLHGVWDLVDTARGTDAYKLLKAGAIRSMSIGFIPETFGFDDTGVRLLQDVELLETSLVALGMNPAATVTSVKAGVPELKDVSRLRELRDVLAALRARGVGGFVAWPAERGAVVHEEA